MGRVDILFSVGVFFFFFDSSTFRSRALLHEQPFEDASGGRRCTFVSFDVWEVAQRRGTR